MRPWQQRAIELLAEGNSIGATMRILEMSESVYFKTRDRHPKFRALADHAREVATTTAEDQFHELGHLARIALHQVLLDETASASLRLRAALAALNRKAGAWLPKQFPFTGAHPQKEKLDKSESRQRSCSMPPAVDPKERNDASGTLRRGAGDLSGTGHFRATKVIPFPHAASPVAGPPTGKSGELRAADRQPKGHIA